MKRSIVLMSLLAGLALTGCAIGRSATPPTYEMPLPAATMAPAMPREALGVGGGPADSYAAAPGSGPQKTDVTSQSQAGERLVIKNADLSIVVADVEARVTTIQNMAQSMGGFVVSANVYQTTTRGGATVPQAQMVIRVPVDKLNDALEQIKKDTVDVTSENQSGQDVTDQYIDLQSQLTAKQAAEEQLLAIMKDAKKTEDVLAVYGQLQQIQTEIQVLKGQIKYTEQAAALSAISINIVAEETVKPLEVAGWKPQGVARDAIQSLIYFEQDFVDFLIRFFLLILPVLVTIAIPLVILFFVLRWLFRRLRKPKPAVVAETPKKK